MKKAVLACASLIAVGAASPLFAQPSPSDCDGVAGNCSVVEQTTDDNEATVGQSGDDNIAIIDQSSTDGSETADVTQAQTGNTAVITQD
ncbi:MAG: hypothetical protein ACOCYR_03180, partial [Erythrobacter sp.]